MLDMSKQRPSADIYRLWFHECQRVYADRLVNDQDRAWFDDLLKECLVTNYETSYEEVVTGEMLVYGDFMVCSLYNRTNDPKISTNFLCI